jgi:hypothetical protein
MVQDCGDRFLFIFLWACRLFFNVIPFPVCNAQLIGDCHENRWGAPKCSVRLFLKISTIPPHCLFRIITFIDGAGDIRAPIYWRRGHLSANILAQGGLGALIYWRSDVPRANRQCSLGSVCQFFSCSVRHSYWRRVHRCANIGGI